MAPFDGQPSRRQQVALALAPKVAAALSVLGSSFVLYDCLWGHRRKQSGGGMNIYHRLMIGLCTCDILMSIGLFTSTWPMPADTENVWGAVGTVESCEAVGFIEQAGVSATMYNGSLSIYYLLRIRYNWAPKQLNKLEKWLHAIPISFGLATMVACILLDQFNSGIFDCWIAPFPQGCDQSWNSDVIDIPCERGDNASLYQFVFDLIPKWSSILLVTVNMWLTYRAVRAQEDSTRRFSMQRNTRVAHRLARQSYFYVGALYLTYIPVIVTRVYELINGVVHYEMLLTISITLPLQGFWNMLVYLRPRFIRERERQRNARIRLQRLTDQETSFSLNSNHEVHVRPVLSRNTILDYLRAISTAVQEGDLSDDAELSETAELASGENGNNMKEEETMKPTGDEADYSTEDAHHSERVDHELSSS